MGLFDRFKKDDETKKNSEKKFKNVNTNKKSPKEYAQEFKGYVNANDAASADRLVMPWLREYPDDANVYYALVILGGVTNNTIEELGAVLEEADARKPMWDDGSDWFKNSAAVAILMKGGRI